MWLQASNISAIHGFSTRHGGVSAGPFASLNLGGSEDDPANISRNRSIALNELGLEGSDLSLLKQVHGNKVNRAKRERQEGDALVSNERDLILAVSTADCYPILFHDPINGVIGAAHAGWRGTCAGIAAEVVKEMRSLGAKAEQIQVSIGPGICADKFQVGPEVKEQFLAKGFPQHIFIGDRIDLVESNRFVLKTAGIPEANITSAGRCSFEDDFFSYRRDRGITGRMWGLISLK